MTHWAPLLVLRLWTLLPPCAGERHGTPAERLLAAQQRAKMAQQSRPHTLFATGPKQEPQSGPPPQSINGPSGFAAGAHACLVSSGPERRHHWALVSLLGVGGGGRGGGQQL